MTHSTDPGASAPFSRDAQDHVASHAGPVDISGFFLVRDFVEQMVAPVALASSETVHARARAIDWGVIETSVANSSSFEHAIGRAVVIADQMSRGVYEYEPQDFHFPSPDDAEPFFAFSVGDIVPDFGDESRYRSKMARRMNGILKRKKDIAATSTATTLHPSAEYKYTGAWNGASDGTK